MSPLLVFPLNMTDMVPTSTYNSCQALVAPHGLMFHHFHGEGYPASQGSIGAEELVQMLEFVGLDRILTAAEWLDRHDSGELQPDHICLTLDDGLRCQFDIALDVLRQMNLTAFWFIPTAMLDGQTDQLETYRHFRHSAFRTLDHFYQAFEMVVAEKYSPEWRDAFEALDYLGDFPFYSAADRKFRFLRDEFLGPRRYQQVMQEMMESADYHGTAQELWIDESHIHDLHQFGHVVGLHSHTHPTRIESLSASEQLIEYSSNLERLTSITGTRPTAMSHPCNSYSEVTLGILKRLGIGVGFRANMALAAASNLEVPREDHANLLRMMRAS